MGSPCVLAYGPMVFQGVHLDIGALGPHVDRCDRF